MIAHPSFHNINFKQAEKMMETMDQGDVVIRPSSKGENHLTVTWKVCDNIYQHVDVREEGKENAFSLGATLWINTEVSGAEHAGGRGEGGSSRRGSCPPPPVLLSLPRSLRTWTRSWPATSSPWPPSPAICSATNTTTSATAEIGR